MTSIELVAINQIAERIAFSFPEVLGLQIDARDGLVLYIILQSQNNVVFNVIEAKKWYGENDWQEAFRREIEFSCALGA